MRLNRTALLLALGLLIAASATAQLPTPIPSVPLPTPSATPTPPPATPTPQPPVPHSRPPRGRRVGKTTTLVPSLITINGNTASLTVALDGLSVEVSLVFEQVTHLTATSLGIAARIASPLELTGRLPAGVVPALPLVFAIEPPADGGLDLRGLVMVNIHTHDLNYTVDSPLRLYSAPLGGNFADITETTGTGSYRACGSKGGFSEFLIVSDPRSRDEVIAQKLDAVQGLLDEHAGSIPPDVLTTLQEQLDAAHDAWSARDYRTASETMESFASTVQAHSGAGGIPDEWRATRDLTNVAGYLRAAAGTLRYSLVLGE